MKLHLKEPRPLMYLSGSGSGAVNEHRLVKMGCKFRCYSYAYTCPGAFYYQNKMRENLEKSVEDGVGVMMDSSAHSFHVIARKGVGPHSGKFKAKNINELRDKVIEHYTEYVKKNKSKWDWYVNFDYIQDPVIVREMQHLLEKKGIRPIPVYHAGHDIEWLRRYCKEGYKLIGIGTLGKAKSYGVRRYYYDQVFEISEKYGVLLHGFAATGLALMYMYPWYSVDSASWVKVAAYGSIIHVNKNRDVISEVHVTDRTVGGKTRHSMLPRELQKVIERQVEDDGFDFKKVVEDSAERSVYNAFVFCNKLKQLQESITNSRVKWKSLL